MIRQFLSEINLFYLLHCLYNYIAVTHSDIEVTVEAEFVVKH
jgi:hypothetical protein